MTRFFKVSGSGNDFLALAEPAETPAADQIRAWCHRGVSLGADGLFVIRREEDAEDATVGMDYYNSDGLPADLCLNGTRCAAQLAFHLGWLEGSGTVRTAAGKVAARRLDPFRVSLEVPPPAEPRETRLEVEGQRYTGWHVLVGVPHFVLPWPEELGDLGRVPVRELGRALRFHPGLGAPGANVNFVRFPARHRLEIRTYERGVEDETLSCGTGVLAGAAVAVALGKGALPLTVLTHSGFELEVGAGNAGGGGAWTLTGDARIVASGDLLPGAGRAPSPPHWAGARG